MRCREIAESLQKLRLALQQYFLFQPFRTRVGDFQISFADELLFHTFDCG